MPAQSIPQENKMGTMPVKKLIFNMALPLIISMLIQALYNIVDSIFVSRISEDAFTAVSLVFPIQNLMIAFATGTGVGMNALLSRRLGEKNREGAEAVANVGLLLAICSGVAFALFGLFGTGLFFSMQKGISPALRNTAPSISPSSASVRSASLCKSPPSGCFRAPARPSSPCISRGSAPSSISSLTPS